MRYFSVVTGEAKAHLYVTMGSYRCVQYSFAQRKLLIEVFVMTAREVQPRCVFFIHGQVQHVGSGCHWKQCTCYHSYLILESYSLHRATASAYRVSIALEAEKHYLLVKKGVEQQTEH